MSFEHAVEHVLSVEGGYTDNPADPGNWTGGEQGAGELKGTKFGISAASYPHLDIRSISREDAIEIYHRDFWLPLGADRLEGRLGFLAFDAAVNHGLRRAQRWLQAHQTFSGFLAHRIRFYTRLRGMWPTFGRGWMNRIATVTEAIADMPNPLLPVDVLYLYESDCSSPLHYALDPERPARVVGRKLYANAR